MEGHSDVCEGCRCRAQLLFYGCECATFAAACLREGPEETVGRVSPFGLQPRSSQGAGAPLCVQQTATC